MKTFDAGTKQKYLARVEAHRVADEIIQGCGWDGHRGCAIGCTLNHYSHTDYEAELGIPAVLALLIDAIHEHLPLARAVWWPGRVLAATPVETDLSHVWGEFVVWCRAEVCQTCGDHWDPALDLSPPALWTVQRQCVRRSVSGDAAYSYDDARAMWEAIAVRQADHLVGLLIQADAHPPKVAIAVERVLVEVR